MPNTIVQFEQRLEPLVEGFDGLAASVSQTVASWFEPLPICEVAEFTAPPPKWLFGTSPDMFEDPRTLFAYEGNPTSLPSYPSKRTDSL